MSDYIALVPPRPPKSEPKPPSTEGGDLSDAAYVAATVGLLILGFPLHIFLTLLSLAIFGLVVAFLMEVVLPIFLIVAVGTFVTGGLYQYTHNRTTDTGREYIASRKAAGAPTGIRFAGMAALLPLAMFSVPFVFVGLLMLIAGSHPH